MNTYFTVTTPFGWGIGTTPEEAKSNYDKHNPIYPVRKFDRIKLATFKAKAEKDIWYDTEGQNHVENGARWVKSDYLSSRTNYGKERV